MGIFLSKTISFNIISLFSLFLFGIDPAFCSELLEGKILKISPSKGLIIIDDYFESEKKTILIPSKEDFKYLKKDAVIKVWVDKKGDVLTAEKIIGTRSCDLTGIKRRFRKIFGNSCRGKCKCDNCFNSSRRTGNGRGRRRGR